MESYVKEVNDSVKKINNKTNINILVLPGSFSPIHNMHIQLMVEAKKYLESKNMLVLGGLLVPSSDDYVKSKLKDCGIQLKHRIELAKLIVADNKINWIHTLNDGIASVGQANKLLNILLSKVYPNNKFTIWTIGGADFGLRVNHLMKPNFICFNRDNLIKDQKGTNIINSSNIKNISSTLIRAKYFSQNEKDWLYPLEQNWITKNVHDYMIKHFDNLFIS